MTNTQAWLTLLLAITAEVTGTALLKLSDGLSRPGPTALLLVSLCLRHCSCRSGGHRDPTWSHLRAMEWNRHACRCGNRRAGIIDKS